MREGGQFLFRKHRLFFLIWNHNRPRLLSRKVIVKCFILDSNMWSCCFKNLGCQTGGSDGGRARTSWRGGPSSPNHHRFLTIIGSMSWGSDIQYWNCFSVRHWTLKFTFKTRLPRCTTICGINVPLVCYTFFIDKS